jgi:lysostaphin
MIYVRFFTIFNALALISALVDISVAQNSSANCPVPALARFGEHRVIRGETLESIAQRYNLTTKTIMNMNPGLRKGTVAAGTKILIPPYNGIVIEVARGQTWRQIAAKYQVRADTLFELNGCQPPSKLAFIPVRSSTISPTSPTNTNNTPINITGYPLPQVATVILPYGWQINATTGEVFFHSGEDLLASVGTDVQAIAPGTVAFASEQGSYGNLIIINHNGGLQSRYAQLENVKVSVGQKVQQGDILGTVGVTGKPTSTQPHLHFEIRSSSSLGWVAKDPKSYLKK